MLAFHTIGCKKRILLISLVLQLFLSITQLCVPMSVYGCREILSLSLISENSLGNRVLSFLSCSQHPLVLGSL